MKLPEVPRPARANALPAALVFGVAAAALASLAATNHLLAKRSERRHPPRGQVLRIDGVDLHYFEAGAGAPVVLIHGNGVSAEDYAVSGLFDRLAADHRVIAFDRPGFGYSARPRHKVWTATAQAELIASAMEQLEIRNATIVAHSWGTLVALRLALQRSDLVAGLGLMSGYYWPTPRMDVPLMSGPAIPVIGDVMRFTLSPLVGRLIAPLMFWQLFSPAKVTEAFKAGFPTSMSLRPSQIRASAGDTAMMPFEAMGLAKHYYELDCPVVLVAGQGDKIASFKHQSTRLAREIGCELYGIQGAGHMVHHTAPDEVAGALKGLLGRVAGLARVGSPIQSKAEREGVMS